MMKSIVKLSLLGKIIKWIKDLFNNLTEKIFCYFLQKNKYGISFDSNIKIDNLMSVVPPLNTFYTLATDLQPFEVVAVDIKTNTVSVRELGTDTEYSIDGDLFIMLFVKKDFNELDFEIDKYK